MLSNFAVPKLKFLLLFCLVLNIFSIVQFKNTGCRSNDVSKNGTCYTNVECQNKGGISSGSCAGGFGVCCLFTVNSSPYTISENCTYIQNPSFPSVYSDTGAITYTINKCSSDVCQVRLDFVSFSTEAPAATTEVNGGACVDSFTATSTSGYITPNICGLNTNQHSNKAAKQPILMNAQWNISQGFVSL